MAHEHTKAPWFIGSYAAGNEPARDNDKAVLNINANGDIAQISNCNPRQTYAEMESNAHLIAAAPELLSEMEKLAQELEDAYDIPQSFYDVMKKARGE